MREFKYWKDVENFILIFIILVLLIFCINVIYLKFIKKEKIIKILDIAFLIVETGSMYPTIKSDELIIIKEQKEYNPDDIVTFWDEDGFIITHRIIEIKDGMMLTKGDANNLYDNKVVIANIEGKVILHSKILGIFVLYFLKPMIIILIISNIFCFFRKAKEEDKNENNKLENN